MSDTAHQQNASMGHGGANLEGWFYASSVMQSGAQAQFRHIKSQTFLQLGKLGAFKLRSSISEGIPSAESDQS